MYVNIIFVSLHSNKSTKLLIPSLWTHYCLFIDKNTSWSAGSVAESLTLLNDENGNSVSACHSHALPIIQP